MRRPVFLSFACVVLLLGTLSQPVVVSAAPSVRLGPVSTYVGAVRPTLTVLDSYDFQFVSKSGEPGRWDPCVPIQWRLYKPGAPKGVLALLKKDFNKVSAITGLVFEYKGYAPRSAVKAEQPGITIAFMPRSSMLVVDGVPNASGSTSLSGVETASGRVVYTGATVTFLRSRFSPRRKVSVWEPLILHELAHAVGLGHVEDATQTMYPYERSYREFQPGDIAGLKRLGAAEGCNPIGL